MVDRPPKGDDVTAAPARALGDPPAAGDSHAPYHEPASGIADVVTGTGNGVAGHEARTRDGGGGRSIATQEKGIRRTGAGRWLRRAVLGLCLSIALFPILLILDSYLIVFDIGALARKAPDRTRVMERRLADPRTPRPLRHRFVSLGAISPHLAHAVVVHEDATFYQHRGFDEFEIRAALQKSLEERRPVRGASTITSQLARNLYLGTERSLIRKLREIPLTVRLEGALEKRRILELYLNFAEWGPGVFGAEAASRYHFGVSARNLSPAQAALMAAALPSPRRSTPAVPSPYLRRRAAIILARMQARGWLSAAAREEGRWALGLRGKPEPVDADLESGAGDELAPVPEPMVGPAEGLDAVPLPETGQPDLETTDPNFPPPPPADTLGAPHGDSAPDATPPSESQNPILPEGEANPLVPDDGSAPEPAGPESDPPIQP